MRPLEIAEFTRLSLFRETSLTLWPSYEELAKAGYHKLDANLCLSSTVYRMGVSLNRECWTHSSAPYRATTSFIESRPWLI